MKINDVLKSSKEEDMQNFLENNSQLLVKAFCKNFPYGSKVLPKYKFGNEYVSDFVIISHVSHSFRVTLIELEPPTEKIFTKSGVYGKRLNQAMKQIDDWIDWIENNYDYFLKGLQKNIDKDSRMFMFSQGGFRRCLINTVIIIGRREYLTAENDKRRSMEYKKNKYNLDITTYDRLVDIEAYLQSRDKSQ